MIHPGDILRFIASALGTKIHDEVTGEFLGKAFFLFFRGKLWIFGYTGKKALRPVPVIHREIRYWRQTIAFCAAEHPDFPRLHAPTP